MDSHLCFDDLVSEFAVVVFSHSLLPQTRKKKKESNKVSIRNVVRQGLFSAVCTSASAVMHKSACFTAI